MSAHEAGVSVAVETAVLLTDYRADVVEIAALRGRVRELERVAASRGLSLPGLGRVVRTAGWLTLCGRPERWLVLQARDRRRCARGALAGGLRERRQRRGLVLGAGDAAPVRTDGARTAGALLPRRSARAQPARRARVTTVMAQVAVIDRHDPQRPAAADAGEHRPPFSRMADRQCKTVWTVATIGRQQRRIVRE